MIRRKIKTVHEKQNPEAKAKCAHYWIIESPHGPTSIGMCKFCGAISEFNNYVPYPSWENKVSKPHELPDISDIEPDGQSDN